MQPIIKIDNQSVYDCRTHSLIRLCEFNVETVLASMIKVIPSSEWDKKLKTISLLVFERFPSQIQNILQINQKLGCSHYFQDQSDLNPQTLQLILANIIQKYLQQREIVYTDQQQQVDNNNGTHQQIELEYLTQQHEEQQYKQQQQQQQQYKQQPLEHRGMLQEDLQQNIPITNQTVLMNLVETINGFCIQYPWWNEYKKQLQEANTDEELELVLYEIAPIMMNRWKQLQLEKQKQTQTKDQQTKLWERLLELTAFTHLDVELSEKEIYEAFDQQFQEFLEVIFTVLQQVAKTNIKIEIFDGYAKIKVNNNFEKTIQNSSENQLKAFAYMFAIQTIQSMRFKTPIKSESTFEVVASILDQLLPKDKREILLQLRQKIEINKQMREKHKIAQEMKMTVEKQKRLKEEEGDIKAKKEKFKHSFNEFLQRETERNEQKEDLQQSQKKKNKYQKKKEVLQSEDSIPSGYSFRGDENSQKQKIPKLAIPHLNYQQQQQMMYQYFYPYQMQSQQQPQISKEDQILLTLKKLMYQMESSQGKQWNKQDN